MLLVADITLQSHLRPRGLIEHIQLPINDQD